MQLLNKSGIACDYCAFEFAADFTYYSFDFHQVDVREALCKHDDVILSVDMCYKCMELFKSRLVEVAAAVPESPLRCDITGKSLNGDGLYYLCNIIKATVNTSSQPYVCSKCGSPRNPESGPCKCNPGGMALIRKASVVADNNFASLNFSVEIFDKFKSHLDYIKKLGDTEWTNSK